MAPILRDKTPEDKKADSWLSDSNTSKNEMPNHNTKLQNFSKYKQRKISKEVVHRNTEMLDGILITKESK